MSLSIIKYLCGALIFLTGLSSGCDQKGSAQAEIGKQITIGMARSDVEKQLVRIDAEYSFRTNGNYIQYIVRSHPFKQGITVEYLAGKIYFDDDYRVHKVVQGTERTGP